MLLLLLLLRLRTSRRVNYTHFRHDFSKFDDKFSIEFDEKHLLANCGRITVCVRCRVILYVYIAFELNVWIEINSFMLLSLSLSASIPGYFYSGSKTETREQWKGRCGSLNDFSRLWIVHKHTQFNKPWPHVNTSQSNVLCSICTLCAVAVFGKEFENLVYITQTCAQIILKLNAVIRLVWLSLILSFGGNLTFFSFLLSMNILF